ncbi:hypothetical protein PEBR_27101 [Penicillium brasilianum]|uniref:Mid2 domain-containing protein n=1 Tax=Penicillium brasilianum TaxID=104259 RepID=A0A1S9RI46_PENBI|nr:hypothetical protein PEBR_27101 [Penicillium brasilianum]
MVPSVHAVDQASPASLMASVNKGRIFFEEHAQIPHGRAIIAQISAQAQLDNWMSSCPSLGSGYFCCGSDNSCCGNSTLILLLGSGTVITKTSSTSTSTSASTSASASASTSVSTTSVPTTKTTTTIFNQSTSAIATNQTTTTSNIQHSVQVDDNNGSGTNVAIAAGVGAGVGIPVCIGIAGLIFFCRRRRRQAAIDEAFYKSRSEKLPPCELELNAPRSEMASTALCELPATRG